MNLRRQFQAFLQRLTSNYSLMSGTRSGMSGGVRHGHRRRRPNEPGLPVASQVERLEQLSLMSTANPLATEVAATSTASNAPAEKPAYGTLSFDFGTDQSPVETGMIRVSDTVRYSPDRGFGLLTNANAVDRGHASDEQRDFIAGEHLGFRIDVPNGLYEVEMTLGDPTEMRDKMQVVINGEVRDQLTTLSKEPVTTRYFVTVTDNQIVVEWNDLGGVNQNVAVNSLSITALDSAATPPDDEPFLGLPRKPVLVIETHGFTSPPKPGFLESQAANYIGSKVGNAVTGALGGSKEIGDKVGDGVADILKDLLTPDGRPPVTEWVYELAREMAKATRAEGLGNLNGNVRPVSLPAIEKATTDAELLKLHKGSQNFLALDWTLESSQGTPDGVRDTVDGNVYNEKEHRQAVLHAATGIYRMIEARLNQELSKDPNFKMDLLFVSHSYGTNVNREVVWMLKDSPLAKHLDYVKVVENDHVSLDADDDTGEIAKTHDKYFWFHPELTALNSDGKPFVDSVVHLYQREGLAFTGVLEGQLTMGQPLDGEDGGGPLGFFNDQLRVFDVATGKELDRIRQRDPGTGKLSDGELRDVVYSHDGRLLAVIGDDGTLRLRDAVTDVEKLVIQASHEKLTDVEFLADGQHISAVGRDGNIRIFRLTDGVEVWKGRHEGTPETVVDVDTSTLPIKATVSYLYRGATRVAFSDDGRLMVTAGTGNFVKLWLRQVEGEAQYVHVQSLPSHKGGTNAIAFGEDGLLVTGGDDGTVRFFRPSVSGVYAETQRETFAGDVQRVVFSPDGHSVAIAAGKSVSVWQSGQDGHFLRVRSWNDHLDAVQALAFTSDGQRLATGGLDKTIFIYDLQTGGKVGTLNQPMLGIRNLSFNADGSRLSAVYFDLKGGPVNDIDVTKQVRDRVGFFENLKGFGSKHHTEVPFVYIDEIVKKGNDSFFEARLKEKAEYGEFTAADLNQPATTAPVTGDFVDSDLDLTAPWLDLLVNQVAPKFVREMGDRTITGETSLSLEGLARDADGNPLQWTVRVVNSNRAVADITNGELHLRPISEGSTVIELTVTDGRWAAQQTFTLTTDGSIQRAAKDSLVEHAKSAQQQYDNVDKLLDDSKKLSENGATLKQDAQKALKTTDPQFTKANQDLTKAQTARDPKKAAYDKAKLAEDLAMQSRDKAKENVKSLKDQVDRSTTDEKAAIKRADNAKTAADQAKSKYDASKPKDKNRQALYDDWQSKKAEKDSAATAQKLATTKRAADEKAWNAAKTLATKEDGKVDTAQKATVKANQALRDADQKIADAQEKVGKLQQSRAGAQADFDNGQAKLDQAAAKIAEAKTALASLDSLTKSIQSDCTALDQHRWVDGLGLQKFQSDVLNPLLKRQQSLTERAARLPS